MERENNNDYSTKKNNAFRPNRAYIKDAIEEYKQRGGVISKSTSGSGSYDDIMMDENKYSEP